MRVKPGEQVMNIAHGRDCASSPMIPAVERLRAFTGHSLAARLRSTVRCVACLAALVVASLPGPACAQSTCPGIHVKILGIKNSTGTVACALFESPDGFPGEYLRAATNVMVIKIRKARARCDFEDIPPGTYAMAVVHDENMNGKLDTNWVGFPTEGYGFSNDAKGTFGAPSFADAGFTYDGQDIEMTMSLHY